MTKLFWGRYKGYYFGSECCRIGWVSRTPLIFTGIELVIFFHSGFF